MYSKSSSNRILSDDFSFTKEAIYSINNSEFKEGAIEFLDYANGKSTTNSVKSYIWQAISATTDDISETLYSNVLNYIDNVSNIDTCTVKALQSMIDALGTNYMIFKHIELMPIDILKLLDFFSIRNDYLLDYSKTSYSTIQKLLNENVLSSTTITDVTNYLSSLSATRANAFQGDEISCNLSSCISASYLSNILSTMSYPQISSTQYLSYDVLSAIEYQAYYSVLSSNIYKTYNDEQHTLIYSTLSDSILHDKALSTDGYKSTIRQYMSLNNIDASFDAAAEVDNIENGISSYVDYSNAEKAVLDIEINARNQPWQPNVLSSRYAYYDRKKFFEYKDFIETEYSILTATYLSANTRQYAVDSNYMQINSISTYIPLLVESDDGKSCSIREQMLMQVANMLVQTSNSIKNIREYLKSHAQRIFMKGTWLLIQYIVNEYLNDNIYPTVSRLISADLQYQTNDTQTTLKQYVDQTQYFNIMTDSKYDKIESSETDTLNSQYWIENGTTNSMNSLDTTSIFVPYEKGKSAIAKSFSIAEIASFYLESLNNRLSTVNDGNSKAMNQHLNDFLSAVFSSAADSTFLDKETGKIMCELKLRSFTHTKDIETFLSTLGLQEKKSQYALSSYEVQENMSLSNQLGNAYTQYKSLLQDKYIQQVDDAIVQMQSYSEKIPSVLEQISLFTSTFQSIQAKYETYVIANLQYTGSYTEKDTQYLILKMQNYLSFAVNATYIVPTMRNAVVTGINNIITEYNRFMDKFKTYLQNELIATNYSIRILKYEDESQQIKLNSKLYAEMTLAQFVGSNYYSSNKYEMIEDKLNASLTKKQYTDESDFSKEYSQAKLAIIQHLNNPNLPEYYKLSNMLSDYYLDDVKLTSCTKDVSSILDYTQLSQYKYKSALFYKYIGLSVGQIPYYNLENSYHPSYQIHPCLKNFSEYVDYSYVIENLLGVSESNIKYIVQRSISSFVDDNGYLLSMWCNPLNGNSDYLSRYEKANHVDERGNINPVYGFDGLHYPAAANLFTKSNGLSCDATELSQYYYGLDLSESDKALINQKLAAYHDVISAQLTCNGIDIYKYGLDIYENSYILVKNYAQSANQKVKDNALGTLWIRMKNHPIAFPAIAYDNSFEYAASQVDFDEKLSSNNVYKHMMLSAIANNLSTPLFTDFIFSLDGQQLLLNGILSADSTTTLSAYMVDDASDGNAYAKASIAINNVKSVYDEDKNRYKLIFAKSSDNVGKVLMSHPKENFDLKGYYIKYGKVGAMYLDKLQKKLAVKTFDQTMKYDDNEAAIVNVASCNVSIDSAKDICLDSKFNGTIDMAQCNSYESLNDCIDYKGNSFNYQNLCSTISSNIQTFENSLCVQTFDVIGNNIVQQKTREYRPFIQLGFIPIEDGENNIVGTNYIDELQEEHLLKFQLIGSKSNDISGIDFKYIYPLRMHEHYSLSAQQPIDDPYCRILSSNKYSGLCMYNYANIHFLESGYNQYIYSRNYANFLDMTYDEQQTYLSMLQDNASIFTQYELLANYDVARYLQAFGSELSTGNDNDPYLVKPYLISGNDFAVPDQYLYARKNDDETTNVDNFVISIFDGCKISASWLKNTEISSGIKIDFNSYYYSNGINGNIRNKYHAFLNLDKPGDAGYLRCSINGNHLSADCNTFFIKNISDNSPKFVMTYVGKTNADPYAAKPFGMYESELGK